MYKDINKYKRMHTHSQYKHNDKIMIIKEIEQRNRFIVVRLTQAYLHSSRQEALPLFP